MKIRTYRTAIQGIIVAAILTVPLVFAGNGLNLIPMTIFGAVMVALVKGWVVPSWVPDLPDEAPERCTAWTEAFHPDVIHPNDREPHYYSYDCELDEGHTGRHRANTWNPVVKISWKNEARESIDSAVADLRDWLKEV